MALAILAVGVLASGAPTVVRIMSIRCVRRVRCVWTMAWTIIITII